MARVENELVHGLAMANQRAKTRPDRGADQSNHASLASRSHHLQKGEDLSMLCFLHRQASSMLIGPISMMNSRKGSTLF